MAFALNVGVPVDGRLRPRLRGGGVCCAPAGIIIASASTVEIEFLIRIGPQKLKRVLSETARVADAAIGSP